MQNNQFYSIAIDGPSGCGKSTVAKKIAKILNFIHIDTGAMYRAVAIYFLENKINTSSEKSVQQHLSNINIKLDYLNNEQIVYLNGKNITDYIRTQEVANEASKIAIFKNVREKLVSLQQEIAMCNNVVMDGRDIATKVLPKANLKVFLTASLEERTRRRILELFGRNIVCDEYIIKNEMKERDYQDSTRENSPLILTKEYVFIDTTEKLIDEVVNEILILFQSQ